MCGLLHNFNSHAVALVFIIHLYLFPKAENLAFLSLQHIMDHIVILLRWVGGGLGSQGDDHICTRQSDTH